MTTAVMRTRAGARMGLAARLAAVLAVCGASASALGSTIWYVDDSAASGGDGRSWAGAFTGLGPALAAAVTGDEVRVGAGRYTPAGPGGTRAATFALGAGVRLRGGYAGVGAPDPDAQDPAASPTVLSGDLSGDDGPGGSNTGENSHHVVTVALGAGPGTVLVGFTVTAGNADSTSNRSGAGVFIESGSPTVSRCVFTRNAADALYGAGGGVCAFAGSPAFTGCVFSDNSCRSPVSPQGGLGGGLYAEDAAVTGCTFSGNAAYQGGGAYVATGASFTGCVFTGNTGETYGGGVIRAGGFSSVPFTLSHCEFRANTSYLGGGVMLANEGPGASVDGCVFTGNTASGFGGGVSGLGNGSIVARSIFSGNVAAQAGGAVNATTGAAVMTNCTVVGNSAGRIGGVCAGASNSRPVLTGCILWDNTDGDGGGEWAQVGRFFAAGTPAVVNYSCVKGLTGGLGGVGNIALDPLFTDPLTRDYTLQFGSPCVNAGDPSPGSNDADGSRNDMGAFSVQDARPIASATCRQLTAIGAAAMVSLDASGSSDPDDATGTLLFQWYVDGVAVCDGPAASCGMIRVSMAYGAHAVLLRVTDPRGAYAEDSKSITVDPQALALVGAGNVTVTFRTPGPTTAPGMVAYQGEIALPFGVNFTEVQPRATAAIDVAGVGVLPATAVAFTAHATNPEWTFEDPLVYPGINRFTIDWRGSRFLYREVDLPVSLRSDLITSGQSVLRLSFKIRRLGGPFTMTIGNGQATVTVDAAGAVTSTAPFEVDEPGRDVTLTLPFPILDTTTFSFTGSLAGQIAAGPYLTQSVGRFRIETRFAASLFPSNSATTPRTVDLRLRVGAEGYPGSAALGPAELTIRQNKWKTE